MRLLFLKRIKRRSLHSSCQSKHRNRQQVSATHRCCLDTKYPDNHRILSHHLNLNLRYCESEVEQITTPTPKLAENCQAFSWPRHPPPPTKDP
nr:Biomphalaria glabrata protocadherin gamma-A10-like [Biomphalaria glabrata]